jgi:hypothetical protein
MLIGAGSRDMKDRTAVFRVIFQDLLVSKERSTKLPYYLAEWVLSTFASLTTSQRMRVSSEVMSPYSLDLTDMLSG